MTQYWSKSVKKFSRPVRAACCCVHLAVYLVAASEATAAKVGERKLFSDLFANYVPEVRPRIDPTQKVNVTADLDLHHIKYLV